MNPCTPPLLDAGADWARRMPKVLLHEHLDGGLRPQTLLELAAECGLALPASEPDALARCIVAQADSGSLVNYLKAYTWTVRVMAREAACERVAFEAAQDALADGVVLAEFRMAPQLLEDFGLPAQRALEAMLRGLARSELPCGLIVCGMRHHAPARTEAAAHLAAAYRNRGVIGFDLAGPEAGYPLSPHARACAVAKAAGLGLTLHAGEADSGDRVLEAAALGATRIGHGVRVVDTAAGPADPAWPARVRDLGVHLEVCPTSNVQTGVAPRLAEHPLPRLLALGLDCSISTDGRLVSGVSVSSECEAAHRAMGLSPAAIFEMQKAACRASFLPPTLRDRVAAQHFSGSWGG